MDLETREPASPLVLRVPDESIRAELVAALNADDSYLGEVSRRRNAGETVASCGAISATLHGTTTGQSVPP